MATNTKSKHVTIAGYGDRIYAIRDSSANSITKIFAEIAARPDYADVAYAALMECTRHKDDDIRESRRTCDDDKDLLRRQINSYYHFFTRTSTVLKAIAMGHWAALEGYGYNAMYTISAKLIRPERIKKVVSLTRTRMKYIEETLAIANDDQMLEILGAVTSRLRQSPSTWAVQAARILSAALEETDTRLADAAAKVRVIQPTGLPMHGMRKPPTPRANAEAAFQPQG